MLRLQDELGLAYIFISHDIGVIRYMCDRVGVMYRGKLVEMGEAEQVCTAPRHAYTRALLSAVPRPDPRQRGIAVAPPLPCPKSRPDMKITGLKTFLMHVGPARPPPLGLGRPRRGAVRRRRQAGRFPQLAVREDLYR